MSTLHPNLLKQRRVERKSQLQIKLNLLYLFKTHSTSLQRILFDTKEIYCTVEIKIAWRDGGADLLS